MELVVRGRQTEDNLGFLATEGPARSRLRSLKSERAADLWIAGKPRTRRESLAATGLELFVREGTRGFVNVL